MSIKKISAKTQAKFRKIEKLVTWSYMPIKIGGGRELLEETFEDEWMDKYYKLGRPWSPQFTDCKEFISIINSSPKLYYKNSDDVLLLFSKTESQLNNQLDKIASGFEKRKKKVQGENK